MHYYKVLQALGLRLSGYPGSSDTWPLSSAVYSMMAKWWCITEQLELYGIILVSKYVSNIVVGTHN